MRKIIFFKIKNYIIISLLFFSIIFLVIRESWFCDDAYFTLRSSLNLHYGYGPIWNAGERVQAFTNPLWMFILSISSAKNIFSTTIYCSVIFTCLTLINITYIALKRNNFIGLLFAIVLLLNSWVFIDFSTSGLETPLSAFIVSSVFINSRFIKKKKLNDIRTGLIIGLSYLTRPDLVILTFFDSFLNYFNYFESKKLFYKSIKSIFIGIILILIPWFLFSIIYYGFPFPSTAYAKIGQNIPKLNVIKQGFLYSFSLVLGDISGSILIFLSIVIIPLRKLFLQKNLYNFKYFFKNNLVLFISIINISYIIWVGGDFMLGRFFYPLIIYSSCNLAFEGEIFYLFYKKSKFLNYLLILFVFLFSHSINGQIPYFLNLSEYKPDYPLSSFYHHEYGNNSNKPWTVKSIGDEKAYYSRRTYFLDSNFLKYSANRIEQAYEQNSFNKDWRDFNTNIKSVFGETKFDSYPKEIKQENKINFFPESLKYLSIDKKIISQLAGSGSLAIHDGPNINHWDDIGLTDQFQARMPVIENTPWRPAHYIKFYPRINKDTLLKDDDLNKIYKSINLITKGNIFSTNRFSELIKQNLGIYNYEYKKIKNKYGKPNLENCKMSNSYSICIQSLDIN